MWLVKHLEDQYTNLSFRCILNCRAQHADLLLSFFMMHPALWRGIPLNLTVKLHMSVCSVLYKDEL